MLNASFYGCFFLTFQDFVMFVNLGASEIVFITIPCTDYEFSAAIFIDFKVKCYLIGHLCATYCFVRGDTRGVQLAWGGQGFLFPFLKIEKCAPTLFSNRIIMCSHLRCFFKSTWEGLRNTPLRGFSFMCFRQKFIKMLLF